MTEADLNTYNLQLQQVEAALTTDPDNEELITLKGDLQQVIDLTADLIASQLGGGGASKEDTEEDFEAAASQSKKIKTEVQVKDKDKKTKSRWTAADPIIPVKPWQVGEHCQAIYSGDSTFHDAVIEEITTDGEVSVSFKGYKGLFVTSLGLLKLPESGPTTVHHVGKNKREQKTKDKEYLKEKKRKKQEKMAEMEAAREKEKSKWQGFSAKAFGKKGFVKKSIFKTPENEGGRVGVGTCGISGQDMTGYSHAAKYRKGQ